MHWFTRTGVVVTGRLLVQGDGPAYTMPAEGELVVDEGLDFPAVLHQQPDGRWVFFDLRTGLPFGDPQAEADDALAQPGRLWDEHGFKEIRDRQRHVLPTADEHPRIEDAKVEEPS